jgi:hypothetical protein
LARQKALEAAEKRRKIEGLMTNGGRRLGGGSRERYELSLRELTAMAAERRRRDNFWCGSGQNSSGIKKPTGGQNSSGIKKPTVGSTTTRPIFNGRVPQNKIPGLSNVNATTSKPFPIRIPDDKLPGIKDSQWTCSQCTFINRPIALQCDVCLAERSHDNNASSYLPQPVVIVEDDDFSDPFRWNCPRCTFENAPDIIMCLGCDYLKN